MRDATFTYVVSVSEVALHQWGEKVYEPPRV